MTSRGAQKRCARTVGRLPYSVYRLSPARPATTTRIAQAAGGAPVSAVAPSAASAHAIARTSNGGRRRSRSMSSELKNLDRKLCVIVVLLSSMPPHRMPHVVAGPAIQVSPSDIGWKTLIESAAPGSVFSFQPGVYHACGIALNRSGEFCPPT